VRRLLRWWTLSVLWSALAAVPAVAGHGEDWTVLTLKASYVKWLLDGGQTLVFIDLRPEEEYRKGHLPGARSFPLTELRSRFQAIPKTGLVVLYCACPSPEIEAAYLLLRRESYRNIAVMDEGFLVWVKKGYPVER